MVAAAAASKQSLIFHSSAGFICQNPLYGSIERWERKSKSQTQDSIAVYCSLSRLLARYKLFSQGFSSPQACCVLRVCVCAACVWLVFCTVICWSFLPHGGEFCVTVCASSVISHGAWFISVIFTIPLPHFLMVDKSWFYDLSLAFTRSPLGHQSTVDCCFTWFNTA